jgi:hypothetical protein
MYLSSAHCLVLPKQVIVVCTDQTIGQDVESHVYVLAISMDVLSLLRQCECRPAALPICMRMLVMHVDGSTLTCISASTADDDAHC